MHPIARRSLEFPYVSPQTGLYFLVVPRKNTMLPFLDLPRASLMTPAGKYLVGWGIFAGHDDPGYEEA